VFLLVPAHPGSPGQRAIKLLSLLCVEESETITFCVESRECVRNEQNQKPQSV